MFNCRQVKIIKENKLLFQNLFVFFIYLLNSTQITLHKEVTVGQEKGNVREIKDSFKG